MKTFMNQFHDKVKGVISGWDRLAFRGTLRWLSNLAGLSSYLCSEKILLKDFSDWAQSLTGRLRHSCEDVAEGLGIRREYLRRSGEDKEALARAIAAEEGIEEGPICMLSAVEPSLSPTVVKNRESKRLELAMCPRKCVWVYFYFNDPVVGFGHVRIESWLPFTIKGCLNGRHWLERSLMREGGEYIKQGNCFRWLADPLRAQALADEQLRTDWPGLLGGFATTYFPVMGELLDHASLRYYWSADETEWATDVMFQNTEELDRLFPMLARHGLIVSDSASVMRYLGKISAEAALPVRVAGDVRGDRRRRYEGVCVKHQSEGNSVKMYNKAGNVLRVETTIRHTRAFKTFRCPNDDSNQEARWLPTRKGVADLERRSRLSQSSNERYLDTLAACPADATFLEIVGEVCQPASDQGRRVRALNPSAEADLNLLRFLAQGQWALNGLRNRDLVAWLNPDAEKLTASERRKAAQRASRLLRLMRAHGLIRKVSKTHRYQVTPKGQRVAALMISTSTVQAQELMQKAA